MALLKIVINVDADPTLIDPHEVADAVGLDSTGEISMWEIAGRETEINFVSAEWGSPRTPRPATLKEAIRAVMNEAEHPMSAPMVLDAIRAKYGDDAFSLCTWLDVHDDMTELYGRPGK